MAAVREDAEGSSPLEGRYANYFKIGYNAFEFLIDFGQFYSEHGQSQLHTRIVTSPGYAFRLLQLLQHSLTRYQETYSGIPTADDKDDDKDNKKNRARSS